MTTIEDDLQRFPVPLSGVRETMYRFATGKVTYQQLLRAAGEILDNPPAADAPDAVTEYLFSRLVFAMHAEHTGRFSYLSEAIPMSKAEVVNRVGLLYQTFQVDHVAVNEVSKPLPKTRLVTRR